jgi:hypothetical protein
MPTVQAIKDELRIELQPIPITEINPDEPDTSVTQAIRKYGARNPFIGRTSVNYQDNIDLSTEPGTIQNVVDVIPDEKSLLDLAGNADFKVGEAYPDYYGPFNQFGGGGAQWGPSDARNSLTNWIQQIDLWAQVQQFLGSEPTWHFDDQNQRLLLDNYPVATSEITIIYEYEPDMSQVDDTFEIPESEAFEWIRDYAEALMKIKIGRILAVQPEGVPDVKGSDIKQEGTNEKETLEQELDDQRDIIL